MRFPSRAELVAMDSIEQAWPYKGTCDLLVLLRNVANANTPAMFDEAVSHLKASRLWQSHQMLQRWLDGTWLSQKQVMLLLPLYLYASTFTFQLRYILCLRLHNR